MNGAFHDSLEGVRSYKRTSEQQRQALSEHLQPRVAITNAVPQETPVAPDSSPSVANYSVNACHKLRLHHDLGILVSSNLTWDDHCSATMSKAYRVYLVRLH